MVGVVCQATTGGKVHLVQVCGKEAGNQLGQVGGGVDLADTREEGVCTPRVEGDREIGLTV